MDGESVNAMLQDTDVPWEFYVMNSITDKDIRLVSTPLQLLFLS
jgi:hypothetical protein